MFHTLVGYENIKVKVQMSGNSLSVVLNEKSGITNVITSRRWVPCMWVSHLRAIRSVVVPLYQQTD